MQIDDKRRAPRFEVALEVSVQWDEAEVPACTRNISLGGMLLVADLDPAPAMGDRVKLSFRLPDLEVPVQVEATVRWVRGEAYGLQFSRGLRARETWALNRFLDGLRDTK